MYISINKLYIIIYISDINITDIYMKINFINTIHIYLYDMNMPMIYVHYFTNTITVINY